MTATPRGAATKASVRLAVVWALLLLLGYAVGRLVTDAHPSWDAAVVADLRGSDGGTVTAIMRFITDLGGTIVLDAVFVAGMIVLLLRRYWRDALFLLLASPGTVVLVQILKRGVNRPRPGGHHLSGAAGFSWPSGHASSSMALYGGLLLILLSLHEPGRFRLARGAATSLTVALVALIGVSRVYLGVHYPTDVIAAWVLVAVWLTTLELALHRTSSSGG